MAEREDRDEPIITSLLDVDWYKITMLQWIWKHFPDLRVKFGFKNRTRPVLLANYIDFGDLVDQLDAIRRLRFQPDEIGWLGQQKILSTDFLRYMEGLTLCDFEAWSANGQHHIEVEGKWPEVTLWETIVLGIVNQMYYHRLLREKDVPISAAWHVGDRLLYEKMRILIDNPRVRFIEFGTRRRHSRLWQKRVTQTLVDEVPDQILGTSNVWLAKELGIEPVGTFAHELYMTLYGRYYDENPPHYSTHQVIQLWWEMYGPALSIALTDTYTTDHFFQCFGRYAEDWRGLRQDSGDPFLFADRAISFYEGLRLDPRGKTIVFSDGLDVEKIMALEKHCRGRIMPLFGWGTNLTNDLGFEPLSLVMKVTEANGHPVVKLSDNPEKASGDPAEVERCKRLIGYEPSQHQAEPCRY